MASVPDWRLIGDWFDICSCDIPCPCEFARPPTGNSCVGLLAWHVREGRFGDVSLDGLGVVGVGGFQGNLWAGEAQPAMGFFMDSRADERQRQALEMIFGGQAGGWPAGFAAMMSDMRGIEFAPIDFELAGDLGGWRVDVPGKVNGRAEALSGPTTPPGKRVQTINPPGSEVGPGQVATWGKSLAAKAEAFGFSFDWAGQARSSKHIPFDWSGPDAG